MRLERAFPNCTWEKKRKTAKSTCCLKCQDMEQTILQTMKMVDLHRLGRERKYTSAGGGWAAWPHVPSCRTSGLPEHLGPTGELMKTPHTITQHTQPRTSALYSLCHAVTAPSCLPLFLPVSYLNSHSLCCTWLNHRHNGCPSARHRFWSQCLASPSCLSQFDQHNFYLSYPQTNIMMVFFILLITSSFFSRSPYLSRCSRSKVDAHCIFLFLTYSAWHPASVRELNASPASNTGVQLSVRALHSESTNLLTQYRLTIGILQIGTA